MNIEQLIPALHDILSHVAPRADRRVIGDQVSLADVVPGPIYHAEPVKSGAVQGQKVNVHAWAMLERFLDSDILEPVPEPVPDFAFEPVPDLFRSCFAHRSLSGDRAEQLPGPALKESAIAPLNILGAVPLS